MEFEKRWITYTIAGVWLLRKWWLFYFAIEYRIDPIDEYVNYMFDAFVLTCAFASLEKYTVTRIGKSLLAAITSVVFVGVIIIQNYFLDYLRFLPHSYGYGMENMTINALKRYLRYGYPGYHWAFLGMLLICTVIIILRASKPRIKMAVKNILFKKAVKTLKSVYFTIILENLLGYLTVDEYKCLKDLYQNEDIEWSIISRDFVEEDWDLFDLMMECFEKNNMLKQAKVDEASENEDPKPEEVDDNQKTSDDIDDGEESE